MYGIQTGGGLARACGMFENDVKMYGIQTCIRLLSLIIWFENDVKMYGIQTRKQWTMDRD